MDGRYRVVRRLGEGGMGSVFEVADTVEGGRKLALKLLTRLPAGQDLPAFLRHEFRALSALRHPHVVRVHDFGTAPQCGRDVCYFTLDLVEGEDFVRATRGLGVEAISELVAQACRGLDYIHARGYVHHDLKPENVLVSPAPQGAPRVTLLDFGLAGGQASGLPATTRGTPAYMAPELFLGQPADPRSDLYSLGVLFYEALTGRVPFEGDSVRALARAHMEEAPVAPGRHRADCPGGVEDLVLRLLAKEPARRPQAAHEVIRDLDAALGMDWPAQTHSTRRAWLHHGPMVARGASLEELTAEVRSRLESRGPMAQRVWVVEGAAGLGKSRLVRELRQRVQVAGGLWCQAEAGEARRGPMGGLETLVRALLAVTRGDDGGTDLATSFAAPAVLAAGHLGGPAAHRASPSPAAGRLEGLLAGAPEPSAGGEGPWRPGEMVAQLVLESARARPLVCCLEDLHAADEMAWDLVRSLSRRLALAPGVASTPFALVVTCRAEDLTDVQAGVLDEAVRLGAARRLVLAPLGPAEVEALAAAMLGVPPEDAALLAACLAPAGGNPYFVEQLLQSATQEGCLVHDGLRWRIDRRWLAGLSVPDGVHAVFERRLGALAPGARSALEVLSALGGAAELALYARVEALDLGEATSRLAALARAGMVRWEPPSGWSVAHPLLRQAVYGALARPRRLAVHRAILAALVARRGGARISADDPDIEELTHHALEAADRRRALRYAVAAVARCRRHSRLRQQAGLARRALALAPRAARRERVELLVDYASALHLLGEPQAARAAAEEACELARALGKARPLALSLLARGRVLMDGPERNAARECLEAARSILERLGEEGPLASALFHLTTLHMWAEDWEAFGECAPQALEICRRRSDGTGEANVITSLAWRAQRAGRLQEALDLLAEAERTCREGGGATLPIARMRGIRASFLADMGRKQEAREGYGVVLKACQEEGSVELVAWVLHRLGALHQREGDLAEAVRLYREALAMGEALGQDPGQVWPLQDLGTALREGGNPREAVATLRKALHLARTYRARAKLGSILRSVGEALLDLGRTTGARRFYLRSLRRAEGLGDPTTVRAARLCLASLYLGVGAWEAAMSEVAAADTPEAADFSNHAAFLDLLRGWLALARGDGETALPRLQEACRRAEALGEREVADQALTLAAEALIEAARPEEALAAVESLEARLERHPNLRLLDEVHLLRGLVEHGRGRLSAADRCLGQLLESLESRSGAPRELVWRTRQALAELRRDAGADGEARDLAVQAMKGVRSIWERLPEDLREGYLARPAVRRLRAQLATLAVRARPRVHGETPD
ncbi:MAG: tetratricopeptide repeat protein [Planctomycetes bacterium]|nr:tetratricopeptide repeat protein [Planctomycetota bacterium]